VVGAFAHNAAPRVLPDGSVAVWFIGYDGNVDPISCPHGIPPKDLVWPDWSGKQIGLARSTPGKPAGPWTTSFIFKQPTLPADWWHWDCSATNPTAIVAADGSVSMIYRGTMCTHCDGCPARPNNASERLGIATAPSIAGPYTRAATPINLGIDQSVEDPFYWRGVSGSHHLIAHSGTACRAFPGGSSWCGVIASSADGANWKLAAAPAYGPNVTLVNGTTLRLFSRQRPQLVFDTSPTSGGADPALLALVNGAQLAEDTTSFMQSASFTLIQPIKSAVREAPTRDHRKSVA
jgi:hypothetical protein